MTTTTKLHSESGSERADAHVNEHGLSKYLPHAAQVLKQAGVAVIRAECENQELRILCFAEGERTLSRKALATIGVEIDKQLGLILRRRYPGHLEGDGSKGFFEWNLRADVLRHEHTRIHHGV